MLLPPLSSGVRENWACLTSERNASQPEYVLKKWRSHDFSV
ncbi:hypothetical protein [Uliginosibacterium sp. TH139]|nr:hypothetical protein [Uliginosibacterium sp. TH139]